MFLVNLHKILLEKQRRQAVQAGRNGRVGVKLIDVLATFDIGVPLAVAQGALNCSAEFVAPERITRQGLDAGFVIFSPTFLPCQSGVENIAFHRIVGQRTGWAFKSEVVTVFVLVRISGQQVHRLESRGVVAGAVLVHFLLLHHADAILKLVAFHLQLRQRDGP